MLKGAIFDHDGLMFDTEKVWQKNWDIVADELGITLPDSFRREICGTSGQLMIDTIARYFIGADPHYIKTRVSDGVHQDCAKHLDPKPGLDKILEFFHKQGIPMAVASSSPIELLHNNLRNAGIDHYFDVVVSGQQIEHGKPAPDIFLLAAEKLGIDPKECYVFEDAYNGVRAGVAAGCYTIMIPDMLQPNEEMKKIASAIYHDLGEAADNLN